MDYLIELIQSAALGYIAWRVRQQKPTDLRDLVRSALQRQLADGALVKTGRERLRARLAAKIAEKQG